MAANCISLKDSKACPAFSNAAVSMSPENIAKFSFLSFVSNTQEFDERLYSYANSEYVKMKYQQVLGCTNVNLSNTSSLYARYTLSVICNGIVQSSAACGSSPPLCAESCAQYATSEQLIAVNPELCGIPRNDYMNEIRADFTVCSNPKDALTDTCIAGDKNEPTECGFAQNLLGLCSFCQGSTANSTDSCCIGADVTDRCKGLTLPSVGPLPPLFPSPTSSPHPSDAAVASNSALSGGQIAGVVVGSVVGLAMLAAIGALLFICLRRRREQTKAPSLNQPSPQRNNKTPMQYVPGSRNGAYEVLPGSRVARMSALQASSHDESPPRAAGGIAAVSPGQTKYHDSSDSDAFGESPARSKRGPPVTGKRNGSLSSASVLAGNSDTASPRSGSGGHYSSPEGMASGQSEQLPYFRDYYSQDDIHPNDKVAVLWAYQPRAGDEFELDRGDMLKVVGIWDDGWATGVRLNERAEDYEINRNPQRDSGVSNGSARRGSSPPPSGEIKAFPLVCVCLPEHWRKTIDGDVSAETHDDS
ncbi:SH3 domain-containing protein [Histoplasma capsulatum var. duboisii H88]|uniref:SH3 domain-containing protein n=1 Tax=Ajellomyces capsulatus (strain H88) TaxID=544711 RepID=F0UN53_AJEC8|nr:SH3 domain-containing protein [Histoplasma capsulatum var. duboisii H88]QSS53688.1 SH3 domain-containing protein [Histoplasma capsulatum var. duboisii H88]